MKLTVPVPGTVIRYSYLWADEDAGGREDGEKDRPALVLALAITASYGEAQVLVLPITHAPPRSATDGIALPNAIKKLIGLDDDPAWVVTTEANAFVWPGPDLRPVPSRSPATPVYGAVPLPFLRDVAHSYLANRTRQIGRTVVRTI